ncbi:molybdate ABC transporter substrate-binding protein [Caulobacter segnis]|uniref:molybdate ABC transporter substrate-binding protein n=1 Tax=Caulobacter segnis TaxID=88688 RepID=UPI00285E1B8E|nr:molybdate ABC transporter substrate-binding protein [Caulobacter segnis]MDR6624626.1 molybdate transport system substrate-binding protein [Caulobacter segnis]
MSARRPMLIAAMAGVSLMLGGAALAGETKVAVAANFTEAAREIATRFKVRTGHDATLSFGSSGQFYAQIANGAPYEVFLSADVERPRKAEAEGLAVPGSRFTYATGRLVLFSRTPGLVDPKGAVLAKGGFDKLAIADPKAAPYGQAAVETLTTLKLHDALKSKIVTGASITQTFQYVQTGAAELGFVALSQVIDEKGGSRWIVPTADHTPIDQQAVLLKTGQNSVAAKAFVAFLKSGEAKAIIRRYGYEVR